MDNQPDDIMPDPPDIPPNPAPTPPFPHPLPPIEPDDPDEDDEEEDAHPHDHAHPELAQKYLAMLQSYRSSIPEHEQRVIESFFSSLQQSGSLFKPEEMVLLDTACHDLLRIKQLQQLVNEHGPIVKKEWMDKNGTKFSSLAANPAVEMLHRAETQFRSNLRELMLTKKEARRAQMKTSGDPLALLIDAEVVENGSDET